MPPSMSMALSRLVAPVSAASGIERLFSRIEVLRQRPQEIGALVKGKRAQGWSAQVRAWCTISPKSRPELDARATMRHRWRWEVHQVARGRNPAVFCVAVEENAHVLSPMADCR